MRPSTPAVPLSDDISRSSSLSFGQQNTPNASHDLSRPSTSANHAWVARHLEQTPVPPYSQTADVEDFDFQAYMRDLDPFSHYTVDDLARHPAQITVRVERLGLNHIQHYYYEATGRSIQQKFRGHTSMIVRHCPGLLVYPPDNGSISQSHPLAVEHFAMSLLAPSKDPFAPLRPVGKPPLPGPNDLLHIVLYKFFKAFRYKAKTKLQKLQWNAPLQLDWLQLKSQVRVPEPLHFDPRTATLITTDLGNLVEVAYFFAPLRKPLAESEPVPSDAGRHGELLTRETIVGLGLDASASRKLYFTTIGARLGLFLANLHGHRWRRRVETTAYPLTPVQFALPQDETVRFEAAIRRVGDNLRRCNFLGPAMARTIDQVIATLFADVSRNDHPEE